MISLVDGAHFSSNQSFKKWIVSGLKLNVEFFKKLMIDLNSTHQNTYLIEISAQLGKWITSKTKWIVGGLKLNVEF